MNYHMKCNEYSIDKTEKNANIPKSNPISSLTVPYIDDDANELHDLFRYFLIKYNGGPIGQQRRKRRRLAN